jgi:DNA-binding PadR family transcriptional regulator
MRSDPCTVKVSMLVLLDESPRRYSEFSRELGRPDKTVFVNLMALQRNCWVEKVGDRYSITEAGKRELRRQSLRRLVDILVGLGIDNLVFLPTREVLGEEFNPNSYVVGVLDQTSEQH